MANQSHDARHLTHLSLESLWQGGVPLVLPVQGTPRCELEIDPEGERISLVTDYHVPEPELAKLQNISFDAVHSDGRDLARITVRADQNIHGAYALLALIADELQIRDSPLAVAVAVGVGQYKDMLTSRGGLAQEEETGLVGELLFLDHLICTIGSGPAVEAWKGPLAEEHDFVFDAFDLEVKTTCSERRRHMISGLTQLVPRNDASLILLSIQITRVAGAGLTLPNLVAQVRRSAGGHVVALDRLLAAAGWKADDADLYPTLWALRNTPKAYFVGSEFPAVTADALISAIPKAGLVSDVSYRLDVTDMDHDALPEPLSEFAEPKGT